MKRKRKINGPFVAIPIAILDAPAWRVTNAIARALWIDLRRRLRNDGLNNGKIYLACRAAAKAIGANKSTIARRYAELEHYGLLRKTSEGYLGSDGRGVAPHYRFTDLAHGTHPPSRDYEKWNGELFVYTPRRTARKKQTPVRKMRTYGRVLAGLPYVRPMRT
jgi:DNA-binding transcriptional MocR family regulator